MKLKSELDRKQEEEIERYRRDNARSSMEIDRLKKMMGKVRAKDAAVQATFTKLNSSSMTSIVDKI